MSLAGVRVLASGVVVSLSLGVGCADPNMIATSADAAPSLVDAATVGSMIDSAAPDAWRGNDASEPSDGAADALVAADGCAPCMADDPCQVATGCEGACAVESLPDGTSCGVEGACLAGSCRTSEGICGDGFVSPELGEGCDDMNLDSGDACSPKCQPTTLAVRVTTGTTDTPTAQLPAVAADGTGDLLFVWLGHRRGSDGENHVSIFARRYTGGGVALDVEPLVLDEGYAVGVPLAPVVTGQASGWVITWSSPTLDGSGAGVAYRLVTHDGALRSRRQANTTVAFDQRDPTVVTLSIGFVIVWTDFSAEISRGSLRMRAFDATGAATSAELRVATASSGQSRPFAAARGAADSLGSRWAVVYTDASGGEPRVRMRRFDGTTALDAFDVLVARTWSSRGVLALGPDATYVAWEGNDGDVHARRVADGVVPTDDAEVDDYSTPADVGMPDPPDQDPSIATFPRDGSAGYVVLWHSTSLVGGPPGGHVGHSSGVVLPESAADLSAALRDRASALSIARTPRGLWFTWADPMTATPATVAAYLLPWE